MWYKKWARAEDLFKSNEELAIAKSNIVTIKNRFWRLVDVTAAKAKAMVRRGEWEIVETEPTEPDAELLEELEEQFLMEEEEADEIEQLTK